MQLGFAFTDGVWLLPRVYATLFHTRLASLSPPTEHLCPVQPPSFILQLESLCDSCLVSPHLLSAPASCEVGPWVVALQWKHEWSRVCSGCTCWREARNMKLEQLVLLCTSEAQFLFKSCVKSLSKFCFGQKFCLILKTTPYKKNKKTFNWLLLST